MNNTERVDTLVITSEGRHLAHVRDFVEDFSHKCGFTDDEIFDIKVAVSEAVANAVEHGSPDRGSNTIKVKIACNPKGLTISVKDQGVFKKSMVAKETGVRGRGIKFMLALMDNVNFIESGEGTTVELFKKLDRVKN